MPRKRSMFERKRSHLSSAGKGADGQRGLIILFDNSLPGCRGRLLLFFVDCAVIGFFFGREVSGLQRFRDKRRRKIVIVLVGLSLRGGREIRDLV